MCQDLPRGAARRVPRRQAPRRAALTEALTDLPRIPRWMCQDLPRGAARRAALPEAPRRAALPEALTDLPRIPRWMCQDLPRGAARRVPRRQALVVWSVPPEPPNPARLLRPLRGAAALLPDPEVRAGRRDHSRPHY